MKIAIQAADLDHPRIDGTRVYIKNLLKYFGKLDHSSWFLIYHKKKFNPELAPSDFPNYKIIAKDLTYFWTQIRLSLDLFKEKPNVLWMPMHNIPYFRPKNLKTVVTIHDLAFKYFPECFPKKELWKLNLLTGLAVRKSDKLITISQSSKKDILKFYPEIKSDKIKVIYHGFDREVFERERDIARENEVKNKSKISGQYILYVGAMQPRKNLSVLIKAFEKVKEKHCHSGLEPKSSHTANLSLLDSRLPTGQAGFRSPRWSYGEAGGNDISSLKLVLAGEKAWLWEDVFKQIKTSSFREDIITPGKIKFQDLGHLMRGAEIFCFPSLYEGFGLPILEAFAARVPVICASNSSLPEVAGEAALYFDGKNAEELAKKIEDILENDNLKQDLVRRGLEQMQKFSWEKCARETLEYLKN